MARTRRKYEATKSEIEHCLNCDKPACACNSCSGPPAVRENPMKEPHSRKGFPDEVRARALALVAEGHSHRQAGEMVGVAKSTVRLWVVGEKRKENEA